MPPATVIPHQNTRELTASFLEGLAAAQSARAASPRLALRPIPAVMPSVQFTDWFQTAVARHTGLCMGIEFMTPRTLINRALALASAAPGGGESNWSKGNLTWRIFHHVPAFRQALGAESASSCRDRFAMAALMADQLDQYGHFRPEMIQKWERGESLDSQSGHGAEAWQRDLWRTLDAEIAGEAASDIHPALLLKRCSGDPAFLAALRDAFPALFVIGTGSLDPLLVEILRLAARAGCRVEAHVVLPSLGYLGEIRKRPARPDCSPEELELPESHPLLASMGRHAAGTFLLLGELDENYAHWPVEPPEDREEPSTTLLGHLQSGIRRLIPPSGGFHPEEGDISLRVHSCFGPRREMEALKDELLRAFRDLPGLQPDEIVIVTPSPEIYGPLAGAILEQAPALPVRLMELPPSEQDAVAEGLQALLALRESRYEASMLLELLRLRAVRTRLGIPDDADALDRLRDWIEASGLTRDLDPSAEESRSVGSWKFARERLVAGCWMGGEAQARYAGDGYILPLNDVLNGNQELKETFLQWHWRLADCLEKWSAEAPLADWSERLGEACDHLLASPDYEEPRQEIQPLLNRLKTSPCADPVDAAAIAEWLRGELEESARRSLPSGKISLGRFKPLQHIPCKVLAMVGMTHGSFPRQNRTPAWDLLRSAPKAWDRNARIDDRQLFLDALLTPSERLIITAPTRNVRSGKTEPFSACVDELLWTVQESAPGCNVIVEHRLQPFAPEYFEEHASALPRSFDRKHLDAAQSICNHRNTPARLPLFETAGAPENPGAMEPLTLDLEELWRFWKDPAKAFLQSHGIVLREDESEELLDRTPMALDALQAWKAKDAILQNRISRSAPLDYTRALLLASRQLPAAALGERVWEQCLREADPVGEAAARIHQGREGVHFLLPVNRGPAVQIAAKLPLGQFDGQTVLDACQVTPFSKAGHFLKPWLEAVAAAAAGKSLSSCLIDPETAAAPRILPPYDRDEALELLSHLIDGYLQGQARPLCYAPEASEAYAKACKQWEAAFDPEALGKAVQSWYYEGGFGSPGEGQRAASQLAWRDQDPFAQPGNWHEWSLKIARSLEAWSRKKK